MDNSGFAALKIHRLPGPGPPKIRLDSLLNRVSTGLSRLNRIIALLKYGHDLICNVSDCDF